MATSKVRIASPASASTLELHDDGVQISTLAWQVVMPQAAVAEVQVLATGIAVANPRDMSQVFAFRLLDVDNDELDAAQDEKGEQDMYLRHYLLPRWPPRLNKTLTRSLHTSPPLHSTYRGYNMHGTLREWALRMINKEDLQWARRSRPRELKHKRYEMRMMELADQYVLSEIKKKERKGKPPTGRPLRLVRTADKLLEEAGNPRTARGWAAGKRVAGDRTGRLREALRLYMRAAQRLDGSMPVIASRIWGTTHFLERRILNTVQKLDTAEKVTRVHYTPTIHDTVDWGVRPKPRAQAEKEERERPLEWVLVKPGAQQRPSARGIEYKTQPALPPLHRLAPSAVERARMPLLQAYPGIGNVGGHVLSLGHAFYASRGLLGTPPPSSPSVSMASPSPSPPSPTLSQPPPSPPSLSAPPTLPLRPPTVPTSSPHLPPPPPGAAKTRGSAKNQAIAKRYFPAPEVGAPASGAASAGNKSVGYKDRTVPELAWVRQPVGGEGEGVSAASPSSGRLVSAPVVCRPAAAEYKHPVRDLPIRAPLKSRCDAISPCAFVRGSAPIAGGRRIFSHTLTLSRVPALDTPGSHDIPSETEVSPPLGLPPPISCCFLRLTTYVPTQCRTRIGSAFQNPSPTPTPTRLVSYTHTHKSVHPELYSTIIARPPAAHAQAQETEATRSCPKLRLTRDRPAAGRPVLEDAQARRTHRMGGNEAHIGPPILTDTHRRR
ncbi:hypothetical protein B0H13DRAFT_2287987 [Mycena leptocephala]|nr:hypothetical protein B0H13DRAFT_2287987 [Mycena leptocephala]